MVEAAAGDPLEEEAAAASAASVTEAAVEDSEVVEEAVDSIVPIQVVAEEEAEGDGRIVSQS